MRRWLAVGPLVAVAGCGPAAAPPPNLVLITLESLRTDHVGSYGGRARTRPELPITPNLDAFAAEAVRFEDAHAVSSWTLTSHASLFTGLYPSSHRVVEGEGQAGHRMIEMAVWMTTVHQLLAQDAEQVGDARDPTGEDERVGVPAQVSELQERPVCGDRRGQHERQQQRVTRGAVRPSAGLG